MTFTVDQKLIREKGCASADICLHPDTHRQNIVGESTNYAYFCSTCNSDNCNGIQNVADDVN